MTLELDVTPARHCTGTTAFADLSLPSGWPHGRVECDVCGAFVFRNRDGRLRAHVPHNSSTETPYERANRAELLRLRIEAAR